MSYFETHVFTQVTLSGWLRENDMSYNLASAVIYLSHFISVLSLRFYTLPLSCCQSQASECHSPSSSAWVQSKPSDICFVYNLIKKRPSFEHVHSGWRGNLRELRTIPQIWKKPPNVPLSPSKATRAISLFSVSFYTLMTGGFAGGNRVP